jgi:integrase
MDTSTKTTGRVTPWNKGKLLGQKPPLKRKEIWAIRIRLQMNHRTRELALFNHAIDSKLRGCDLVGLRVHDVVQGSHVAARAIVMQRKTQRPAQFKLTEQTRDAVAAWIAAAHLRPEQFLFPSRVSASPHLSTRQYSRIVGAWVRSIGLDPAALRHPFHEANQADADLPADQEPPGRPTSTRPHQTGKHVQVPRDRGRRRAGDRGANRGVGGRWTATTSLDGRGPVIS